MGETIGTLNSVAKKAPWVGILSHTLLRNLIQQLGGRLLLSG